MTSAIRSINVQVQSFGNYLQDMWIVAMILVLFKHETTISLPFVWITLQIVIAVLLQVIYRKMGPNIFIAVIVPTAILFILFSVHGSFLLYIILVVISSWRAYIRYNTLQNELTLDSSYTLFLFCTFLCVYFFHFFMKYEGFSETLFIILVSGILLFVGIRLFTISLSFNKITKLNIFSAYVVGISALILITWIVYSMMDNVREMFDVLITTIVGVLVIPFGPLIEYLMDIVNGLNIQPAKQGEQVPLGEQSEIEQVDRVTTEVSANFPFEWVILGVIVLIVLIVLVQLMKRKRESFEVEISNLQYENKSMLAEEEVSKQSNEVLYEVETSLLREKYIQFEQEAKTYEFERGKSETVREWFQRMGWSVEEEFFRIYETVRYGGQSIKSYKAEFFIKTLENAKIEYFIKIDV